MPFSTPAPRRAVAGDADQLVTLRAVMLRAMGEDTDADPAWQDAATEWFRDRLSRTGRCAAFVIEDEAGTLLSSALGTIQERAPSPGNPAGLHGVVSSVATLPAHRGRGHARAVVTALLHWFDTETPVRVIDLSATSDGTALYRSLGFTDPGGRALRRKRP